jgi:hypothetical protein
MLSFRFKNKILIFKVSSNVLNINILFNFFQKKTNFNFLQFTDCTLVYNINNNA